MHSISTETRSKTELEELIRQKREELANVTGAKCEVYTRIVGYYRPVANWNPGKKEELKERVVFAEPESLPEPVLEHVPDKRRERKSFIPELAGLKDIVAGFGEVALGGT